MQRKFPKPKKPSRKMAAPKAEEMEGTTTPQAPQPSPQQQQEQPPPQQQQQQPQGPPEPLHLPQQQPQQQQQQPPSPPTQPEPATSLPVAQSPPQISSTPSFTSKGKASIYVPETPQDLEAQWAHLFVENIQLKSTIRDNDALIADQAAAITNLSTETKLHKISSTQSSPRITALETALTDSTSKLSLIEEEASDTSTRTIAAGQGRTSAEREATKLRALNNTLLNKVTDERRKVADQQEVVDRMKGELDTMMEERLRSSVLESENARLRVDIMAGMEQMRLLVQNQQEVAMELHAEDAVEPEGEAGMVGENLGELGIRWRGDSIWEENEAGPQVSAPVGEAEVLHRATQTTTPPPPSPAPAMLEKVDAQTSTSPLSPGLPPLVLFTGPTSSPTTNGPSRSTQTEEVPAQTHRTSFLPLLLLLLTAFFLALYADRLASEREIWAAANGAIRGLTAGWNGREWWSHMVGEVVEWEVESWSGVDRALLG